MAQKLLNIRWLLLSFIIVIVDQYTKHLVTLKFSFGESMVITPFFNLILAHNQGAAFSFLSDAGGWQRWLFSGLSIGISIILVVWLCSLHRKERLVPLALALIIGGAIGNVIDRLSQGYVVDFLDFHIKTLHWPAFNVADSSVCVGAVLLAISLLKEQ